MNTVQTTAPVCNETTARQGAIDWAISLFKQAYHAWRRRAAYLERRRAFMNVAALDDRSLADIGLTRGEVETAANLPLDINASLAVRQMAAERRAQDVRMLRR